MPRSIGRFAKRLASYPRRKLSANLSEEVKEKTAIAVLTALDAVEAEWPVVDHLAAFGEIKFSGTLKLEKVEGTEDDGT
jgi:hypothetical protein